MHPPLLIALLTSLLTTTSILIAFPFPTTIPLFLGFLAGLFAWCLTSWLRIALALVRGGKGEHGERYSRLLIASDDEGDDPSWTSSGGPTTRRAGSRAVLVACSVIMLALCCLGFRSAHRSLRIPATSSIASFSTSTTRRNTTLPAQTLQEGLGWTGGKVFIAANLYNVDKIWDVWSSQVLALSDYRAFFFPSSQHTLRDG